ncbi:unnamed protein product [Pneumocystis jirovecii]|uniref:U3 small nucleolar RNA-associated protein 20 N-terminal domain-containing protein n=1 Tax=Pneumocystis jirovecii TaxID=42068 RepID=L0PCN9_PNEJI|nr:unnamed protein product [Pneumocystis jirovecii]
MVQLNIEHMLLKISLEIPSLAEEHSKDLVPIFLTIFSQDRNIEDFCSSNSEWSYIDKLNLITIFSKFQNPKSIFNSENVYSTLLFLLTQGDIKIQNLALNSILSWKFPEVLNYENNLRNLLSTLKFRNELTDLMQETCLHSNFKNQKLIPIILRILYGRMISRSNSSSKKHSLSTKRDVILSFVSVLPLDFFRIFLNIMLEPFNKIDCIDKSNSNAYKLKNVLEHVNQKKQIGFCTVLKEVLKHVGSNIMLYLSDILNVHFYCWNNSESIIKSFYDKKEINNNENITLKYAKAISHEWMPYMTLLFAEFINPKVKYLHIDSLQEPSGLLKIFSTWSENINTLHFLYDYNKEIILEITKCLSLPSIKENVLL